MNCLNFSLKGRSVFLSLVFKALIGTILRWLTDRMTMKHTSLFYLYLFYLCFSSFLPCSSSLQLQGLKKGTIRSLRCVFLFCFLLHFTTRIIHTSKKKYLRELHIKVNTYFASIFFFVVIVLLSVKYYILAAFLVYSTP